MNREELLAAYRATEFHIEGRDGPFVMKIGEYCKAALRQISSPSSNCGAFITAYNPRSVLKSKVENEDANGRLSGRLTSTPARQNMRDSYGIPGPIVIARGVGRDPTGKWPEEHGAFITWGLPAEYLLPYALEFGQNAFVFIPRDGIPQLIEVDHDTRTCRVSHPPHSSSSTPA